MIQPQEGPARAMLVPSVRGIGERADDDERARRCEERFTLDLTHDVHLMARRQRREIGRAGGSRSCVEIGQTRTETRFR